jgi:hypothetical protein
LRYAASWPDERMLRDGEDTRADAIYLSKTPFWKE